MTSIRPSLATWTAFVAASLGLVALVSAPLIAVAAQVVS